MKHICRPVVILICLLSLDLSPSHAQDIHFSQFYETAVLRNPALTGIFSDDYKAGVVYRNQWNSLGYPYQTMVVSAETRFSVNRSGTDYITISALFFTDKAGHAALKTTGIYPCINYNKSLSDPHNSYLSVGFAGGLLQRSYDFSKLTFDNQYQGGSFVASAGAGEALPVAKLSQWDLGAGVSFNSGVGENNDFVYFIGLSAFHLTQPRATFADQAGVLNLATRWNASLGLHATLNDIWSAQVHANYAMQGTYREMVVGGLIRWARPDQNNTPRFAISGGAFYRLSDAIIPTLKLEYKKESFGISYDINTSPLKAVTKMRGGLELTACITGFLGHHYEDKHTCPRF